MKPTQYKSNRARWIFRIGTLVAACHLMGVTTARGQSGANSGANADSTWLGHNRAARADMKAHDYVAAKRELLKLDTLLSGNPAVIYSLASVDAALGDTSSALGWLETFASAGLARDFATDSAFASLRGSPRFAAVLQSMSANANPVSHSDSVFAIRPNDLLAEDIALDPATHTFFVTSIRHRKVVAIDASGAQRDFVLPSAHLWSPIAARVDPSRHMLWITSAALPQAANYQAADSSRSALLAYDLVTGSLMHRYDVPADGKAHALGDIVVAPDGDVFASDGSAGIVYALRSGARSLTVLVPAGELPSPQTPAFTPDGVHLYVPDYVRGLAIVDTRNGAISWVTHDHSVAVNGIDGLYSFYGDLIAVQNGTTPARVIRFHLDPSGRRITGSQIIESNTPHFGVPTHGVVAGDNFYFITNSGWNNFDDDGKVNTGVVFSVPVIRRATLR